MDQYIGKMLDNRYELLELIGHGGMANVYKAKCHRLNRLVAVKILKSDLAENADFRRRFRDESLAVAQLSHANIVSVYDVSSSDGIEYIVMELIDGITLKQYMERRGKLDWREALHFISQIMRGLSHAHSRGIVHRDIKPQNIMVLRDGSVKVADFGIACLADAANTLTQEALGSVHYISPEQARGDRTDARSDIYSAGVVLYEMLTGRLPFEGDSAVSVAIQHLSSTPLDPREINPDIPESLELICKKAMCPELSRRYVSAEEMLDDLEKFRTHGLFADKFQRLGNVRVDFSGVQRCAGQVLNGYGHRAVPLKGQTPGQHLVKHHAGAVNIAAGIGAVTAGLFRRNVMNAAQGFLGHGVSRIRKAGDAKISHLHAAITQNHNVLRFDVPMDDTTAVGMGKSAHDLTDKMQGFPPIQLTAALHVLLQGNTVNQFHDDVLDAIAAGHVIDRDDVGVAQLGDCQGFIPETAAEVLILR